MEWSLHGRGERPVGRGARGWVLEMPLPLPVAGAMTGQTNAKGPQAGLQPARPEARGMGQFTGRDGWLPEDTSPESPL